MLHITRVRALPIGIRLSLLFYLVPKTTETKNVAKKGKVELRYGAQHLQIRRRKVQAMVVKKTNH